MTIYGWIGGGLAVLYNIPQIVHVYRVKQIHGISNMSVILRMISYILVIYHSFTIDDPAIMYTTSIGLFQLIIIYIQLCIYKKSTIDEDAEN